MILVISACSLVLGGTFWEFDEFVFLFVVDLHVELQFLVDIVIPFLLHFEIESMFCFVVVLLLQLECLFYSSVESLRYQILELLAGVLLFVVHSSQKFEHAQGSDEVVPLLVI